MKTRKRRRTVRYGNGIAYVIVFGRKFVVGTKKSLAGAVLRIRAITDNGRIAAAKIGDAQDICYPV